MLALIAAFCFLLSLLSVSVGTLNLITLGLLFLALHLAFGGGFYPVFPRTRR